MYDSFETATCLYCHQDFKARKQDRKRGLAVYCSRKCWGLAHRGSKNLPHNATCAWCGKPFRRGPQKLKLSKSGLHFCGRDCKDKAQCINGLKEIHLPHYGTGFSSYRERTLSTRTPVCAKCGYDKFVGVLVVHHADRDRTNCSDDNLTILCPTCHAEEHVGGDGLIHFGD
jgi:hypothetical protein